METQVSENKTIQPLIYELLERELDSNKKKLDFKILIKNKHE